MNNRARLETAILDAMDRACDGPMVWGKDDCATWCADIIQGALGYDPARKFRGRYKTRKGAARVLGPNGLKGAMRVVARRHKWKRIHPAYAKVGDWGLAWTEYLGVPVLAAVVCRAPGWFVGRNDRGFSAVRAGQVPICWSVLDDCEPGATANIQMAYRGAPQVAHAPIVALGVAAYTAITATAIGTFLFTTALSIGLSLVSSLLQPHVGASLAAADTPQSVQVTERQSIPYKRIIVGTAFVGGALFFEQVKSPYLYQGILINYGEIAGVQNIYIGTNQLAFFGITPGSTLTPTNLNGQPDYASHLKVSLRYGASDQAIDPLIASDFTSMSTEFRQRGIAAAVLRYHYGGTDNSAATQAAFTALWGQVARPNAYFLVQGVNAYDPRDPSQLLDDQTTWKWTNNATLVQAFYLTQPWGGRIPTSKIRWDKIADSANYDDESVPCKDGTFIKRYTVDGVISLDQRPSDVMPKLLTANRASVLESGGKVWIQSSRPQKPIVTIHDGILTTGIKYQSSKAKRDLVNQLQVRVVAPGQDYQVVDGPVLDRVDLQTVDQEVFPATLSLDYTLDTSTNCSRAQRLQKAFLSNARLGRTITCSVDTSILSKSADELVGSVATFDSQLFTKANGTYLITSVGFADDFSSIALALTEYDASIETDWNPAVDEQDFTIANLNVS